VGDGTQETTVDIMTYMPCIMAEPYQRLRGSAIFVIGPYIFWFRITNKFIVKCQQAAANCSAGL
jgi:hypothetical protein